MRERRKNEMEEEPWRQHNEFATLAAIVLMTLSGRV